MTENANYSSLVLRRLDDTTVAVGFNTPGRRNVLDLAVVEELHDVLERHSHDPTVLILHSTTEKMFVAGADIAELRERDASDALKSINAGLFERLEAHRWPTIAAIDGYALGGGCELALACDFRVATPRSLFGQPELGLGIIAGAGANWRLPQLVGIGLARRMLFIGERLSGQQAFDAGLVDGLSEPGSVVHDAHAMAATIAKNSWQAIEMTKLALRQNRPATTSFDIVAQAQLFESDEKRARMDAFLNKGPSS